MNDGPVKLKPQSARGENKMAKFPKKGNSQAGTVLLEVSPQSVSGDLAPRAAVPEDFRRRASEIADSVAAVADEFKSHLTSIVDVPTENKWGVDSIEISFEIAVQAEAGVVIAKASSSATFSVTLTLQASTDRP